MLWLFSPLLLSLLQQLLLQWQHNTQQQHTSTTPPSRRDKLLVIDILFASTHRALTGSTWGGLFMWPPPGLQILAPSPLNFLFPHMLVLTYTHLFVPVTSIWLCVPPPWLRAFWFHTFCCSGFAVHGHSMFLSVTCKSFLWVGFLMTSCVCFRSLGCFRCWYFIN